MNELYDFCLESDFEDDGSLHDDPLMYRCSLATVLERVLEVPESKLLSSLVLCCFVKY